MIRLEKLEGTLLFSFLLLFIFALLYIFRSFDTNTLASWRWVFGERGFTAVLPYLLLAIVFSFVVSQCIPLERHPIYVLIATAGTSVFLLWNEPELMLDSGRYFLQAKSLSEYGAIYFFREWGQAISSWTDMPLAPFLYGLAFRWGGETRIAIQLLNSVIFILVVILTYRIGTSLWSRETGFHAGLMLTGIPYLLTQVPQMLVDVHAMFFLILAVYCFLEAIKATDRLSICMASATFVLAVFVKYSTWPMLALLPVSGFIVFLQERRRLILKRAALVFLWAFLFSLILIFLKRDVFAEQMTILIQYQKPALKLWSEGLFASFAYQFHPFIGLLVLVAIVRACRLRDKLFLIVLLYLAVIAILQIQRIRYLIPVMPFIALAAAYGLTAFSEIKTRRFITCMIVSTSLAMVFVIYLPFFHTTSMMNIKTAGEALSVLEGKSVTVTVLPQENSEGSTFIAIPLLDLFTEKKIFSPQRWPRKKPEHLSGYSPLLFTWYLHQPPYYELSQDKTQTVHSSVVISPNNLTPENYRRIHRIDPASTITHFNLDSGTFRFRTIVSVSY